MGSETNNEAGRPVPRVASAGESSSAPAARRATAAEAGDVVELFTLAFHQDPTWSWAFPDPEARLDHHRAWWSLFMHTAVPYGWVWMTEDGGAASSWIPPGKPELSEEDDAQVEALLRRLVGARADDVLTLLDRFDSNHPSAEPHFYLSLLGTHPDHRGQGKGMGLLAANLARIDRLGIAGLPRVEQPGQRSPLRAARLRPGWRVRGPRR